MKGTLPSKVGRLICEGAAPGGALTLIDGANASERFAWGLFSNELDLSKIPAVPGSSRTATNRFSPFDVAAAMPPSDKPASDPSGYDPEIDEVLRKSSKASPAVSTDTIYDLASITKLFTTALILRLHASGKIKLQDKCALFLPNFRDSRVRIIDLLTHRFGKRFSLAKSSQDFESSTAFRSFILEQTPPTKALDKVIYGNIELFYAGVIVEIVTGNDLDSEFHQLFAELGLIKTFTGPDIARLHLPTPPTEIVHGTLVQGVTHDESTRKLGGISGVAGVFASADDLAQFGAAWLEGKIVDQKIINELVFKNYDPDGSAPQALGWWIRLTDQTGKSIFTPDVYSHTGFTGSFLAISPLTKKIAAFTSNRTYYGRDNHRQREIYQLLASWVSQP